MILDKARISVLLVHRREAGDADAVPKDFERNILGDNYAESLLRMFKKFPPAEGSGSGFEG